MSPSRIPRPSASPGQGQNAGVGISPPHPDALGRSQAPSSIIRSNPSSPSPAQVQVQIPPPTSSLVQGTGFKPNNPFAQRTHGPQSQSQSQSYSPSPGRAPQSPAQSQQIRRRPKPPSTDDVDPPQPTSGGTGIRRPIGNMALTTSPEAITSPRTMSPRTIPFPSPSPAPAPAPALRPPQSGPRAGGGAGPQRSCLRQPSTPAFSRGAGGNTDVVRARPRATSVATATAGPKPINGTAMAFTNAGRPLPQNNGINSKTNPSLAPAQGKGINTAPAVASVPASATAAGQVRKPQHLFEASFADTREPAVPPHIRVRLRLIHKLGVVLGIDAQGISSKLDIPGLLARVDAAYDRGFGGGKAKAGQTSGLPLPLATTPGPGLELGGTAMKVSKSGGMLGMFKRLGGGGAKGVMEEPLAFGSRHQSEGPAFGVPLNEMPNGAWCTSLIGGQKHELPLVVFTIVEEIYRRGMSHPGIFRLAGDGTRISHLSKVFNLPPLYGDSLSISNEPIHNLTGLVKRYVRDLPEPILDEGIFPAFLAFCIEEPDDDDGSAPPDVQKRSPPIPLPTRIIAAQILLRLLPPLHFSLFIYLLAFLGQLPLFPDNRLNIESISIIFGPAMCAARGRGITGLGPNSNSSSGGGGDPGKRDGEMVSDLVNSSQGVLGWLLRHWGSISEKVLDDDEALVSSTPKERVPGPGPGPGGDTKIDPRLLSPIDLRSGQGQNENPFRRANPSPNPTPASTTPPTGHRHRASTESAKVVSPLSTAPLQEREESNSSTSSSKTAFSDTATAALSLSSSPSTNSINLNPTPSTPGFLSRALSSMSIASDARGDGAYDKKPPKRSASFTSLSSLMKKGGGVLMGKVDSKGASVAAARSLSEDVKRQPDSPKPTVNPQITNVLGSLHDLLVSKDKQIERDARELALLRHTLLEMDEKLQRATSCPSSPVPIHAPNANASSDDAHASACATGTPKIIITATPSTLHLSQATQSEITDLQSQLTTALAALETSHSGMRTLQDKVFGLEAKISRMESEKKLEISKLEVALALEQARIVGLIEERDLARDRLDKVKTTLFSVG